MPLRLYLISNTIIHLSQMCLGENTEFYVLASLAVSLHVSLPDTVIKARPYETKTVKILRGEEEL